MSQTALVKKESGIDNGKLYAIDLKNIPADCFDEEMFAMPFIMFGEDAIIIADTDLYVNNTVNEKEIKKEIEE